MRINIYIYICLIFLANNLTIIAQNKITIRGKIIDSIQNPVSNKILYLKTKNDLIISLTYSDDLGNFKFKNISNGTYILKLSDNQEIEVSSLERDSIINIPAILYDYNPYINLNEVVVNATKRLIKIEEGKTILNLQNGSLLSSNLIDAIQVAPGVLLDRINKKISFEGKTLLVFIDGRQIQIPSSSIFKYIESIPTSTIKYIEFDPNPGAKYDASEQVAIINITTKKINKNSWNLSTNAGFNKFQYHDISYGANLIGNINKFDFSFNYDGEFEKIFNNSITEKTFFNENSTINHQVNDNQNEIVKTTFQNVRTNIGYSNKKSSVGLFYDRYSDKPNHSSEINSYLYDYRNNITQNIITNKAGKSSDKTNSLSLFYSYKIDSIGSNINLLYDRTRTSYNNEIDLIFFGYPDDSTNIQGLETKAILNLAKLDYNNSDKSKYFVESGVRFSWVINENFNFSQYLINNYKFDFEEDNIAGYFSIKRKWTNWIIKLGLRIENTTLEGTYFDYISQNLYSLNNNRTNLFPNIYIGHIFNEKNSLGFIVDTKIIRPNYGQFNPFPILTDTYNIFIGNPNLLSSNINNYSLQYTLNKKINFKIFFSNIQNQIITTVISNDNNISTNQPINLDYSNYYGLSISSSASINKWWNINFWGQIRNIDKKGFISNRELKISVKNNYSLTLNQQFLLPQKYMINLNAFIQGNDSWGGLYHQPKAIGSVSLNAQKEFLKKNLGVELFIEDLFNTNSELSVSYKDNLYTTNMVNRFPGRKVGLKFTFNIGKDVFKRNIDNNSEEKNRTIY